jgi:hypothetical protein
MNITKIEPIWNHGWANDPDIEVHVDGRYAHDAWLYDIVSGDKDGKSATLLSTNLWPWVRFVAVADKYGKPQYNGALAGEYKLTDGDTYKTTSGWSSRSGVFNRDYIHKMPGEIVGVKVRYPGAYSLMAGMCINAADLVANPAWPRDLHLVRVVKFRNEPYWVISSEPDKVVKGA